MSGLVEHLTVRTVQSRFEGARKNQKKLIQVFIRRVGGWVATVSRGQGSHKSVFFESLTGKVGSLWPLGGLRSGFRWPLSRLVQGRNASRSVSEGFPSRSRKPSKARWGDLICQKLRRCRRTDALSGSDVRSFRPAGNRAKSPGKLVPLMMSWQVSWLLSNHFLKTPTEQHC